MIRLTVPSIDDADLDAVREALASGHLVQGPRVAAFESAVQRVVGTGEVVAVANGTAALQLALLALGVGPGDLVVTTAYSWPATANVVELCGAQPVFVDIDPDTFNIAPDALEATLVRLAGSRGTARRVKAILPVHAFGLLADMPAILALARRFGVPVVEDAACAIGATLDGRQAGGWGDVGCFSFHPRKAVTTGEGGAITTDDAAVARTLRALRNHGMDPEASTPEFVLPGFNYRLTEFQAALGVTQLAKLERILEARRAGARVYDALLADTPVRAPVVPPGHAPAYQSYVVLLPDEVAAARGDMVAELRRRGIETTIGTWHMPRITYYRARYGFAVGDFPVADAIFARALTLPLHEHLTQTEQRTVVDGVLELSTASR